MIHIPVLQKEVLQYLDPKQNERFIDCTIGEGGHALAILERILPKGRVLGIDWNPELIQKLKDIDNLILVCDNFANLKDIVKRKSFKSVQGILFDLGISSWHLEESKRGFSFLRNEPLDMRYNSQNPLTTEKIVNYSSTVEIEKILSGFGEERFAKEIAKEIVNSRKIKPIKTTLQLVGVIQKAVPSWYQHRKIHFATKTFQALRITVNNELSNLEKTLPQTLEILKRGGRLVIISFHSLEDIIVKKFYRNQNQINLKILNKKPIRPSQKEIIINPRSRSAKLRAAEKI